MKTLRIIYFSLLNFSFLLSQISEAGSLFELYMGESQKNIRISKRIQETWNLQNTFLQTTHYNSNLDDMAPNFNLIKQVLLIYYKNNTLGDNILELLDDGNHFDNEPNDGIYGNYLCGDFNEFRTEEMNIDIQWDTLGLNYHIFQLPVTYLPRIPWIIVPIHGSVVYSRTPEIYWEIDSNADGCGIILLSKTPVLGQELEDHIWMKEYRSPNSGFYEDKIPVPLSHNTEYTLICWTYRNTDINIGNHYAYSIEWSQFYVDTLQRSENLVISNNFPNPFNNYTIINYNLPDKGDVSIKIYNILGKYITALVNKEQSAGDHYIHWNGKNNYGNDVPSGIYLYKIAFNKHIVYSKMMLMR